jgi:hypothetical protein
MTAKREKAGLEVPSWLISTPLPGETESFIIDRIVSRNSRILEDFKEGRTHFPPCVCWLCLWRKYEKSKSLGHPYDVLTFLAWDILCEIKDEFQDESVSKIPVGKLAKEIIRCLPIINPDSKLALNEDMKELFEQHFIEYAYKKRYQREKLLKIIAELRSQIDRDWKKSRPKPVAIINLKRQTPGVLALKIARFIYSRPSRRATRREIQRHTNKSKADLEGLHELLKVIYGINVQSRGKYESPVYLGTIRTDLTRLLRVGDWPKTLPKGSRI